MPTKQRLLQYNLKTGRNLKFDTVSVLTIPFSSHKSKNTARSGQIAKRRQHNTVSYGDIIKE